MCAASDRHFPVLRKSSRQHHVSGLKRAIVRTSKPNKKYHEKSIAIPRLCSITGGGGSNVPCKRHGISMPQRCFVPQRTGSLQPHGKTFPLSNDATMPENNGAVLNIAQIIKTVMTSAAETEIGAMFINAREAVPQRMTWWRWATRNREHPCIRTIPLRMLLSLIMCNREEQKQRT